MVRYRVDGIMREIMRADRNIAAAVASRIKIMSNLDIAVKRKPQDGKAQVKQGGKIFDLRVSSLPTSYGEKVTIRILNPATAQLNPEDLGFSDKDLRSLNRAIHMPQGDHPGDRPYGLRKILNPVRLFEQAQFPGSEYHYRGGPGRI